MNERSSSVPAWLLLGALVLFACNAWGYDLWAPDEPYFGEGAREMVADGQWLVPHVNGVITTDKPPVFFWLIALVSWPFGGVTPFLARLPSMLAGLGSVILVVRLGQRLAGERTGLLAGVVLATAYLPWDKARTAQIDALLMFLTLGAISAFAAFRAGELDGRRAGVIFWALAGVATLAKGPVGFLLPLGAALVTLVLDRNLRSWGRFAPLLGPLAFVLVVGAWGVPASIWGGEYSLIGALRTHFVDRGLKGMHHQNPPWYYFGTIPLHFLPWSALLPAALVAAWRRRDPADRLLLAWPVFVVLFFTLSGERRDLYVLPAFPALALLVARMVDGVLEGGDHWTERERPLCIALAVTGVLFTLVGVAAPIAARRQTLDLGSAAIVVGVTALAAGIALLVSALRGRTRASLFAAAGGMAAIYLAVVLAVFPVLDPVKSARAFSRALAAETADARAAGQRVLAFRLSNLPEAISFYSGVYTLETGDVERLVAHAAQPGEQWIAADAKQMDDVPADLRARLEARARAGLSRMDVVLYRVRALPESSR